MEKDAGKVVALNGEENLRFLADVADWSGNDDIDVTTMDMAKRNDASRSRLPPKKRGDFRGGFLDLNEPFHGPTNEIRAVAKNEEEKLLTNTEIVGLELNDLRRREIPSLCGEKKRRSRRKPNLEVTAMGMAKRKSASGSRLPTKKRGDFPEIYGPFDGPPNEVRAVVKNEEEKLLTNTDMSKTKAEWSKLLSTENNGNEEKHGKLTRTAKPKCSKRGFSEINSREEKHGGSSKAEKQIYFKRAFSAINGNEEQNGRARKAAKKTENNGASGSRPPLPIPTEVIQKIAGLRGDNLKMVIQKELTKTDLDPHFGRLNMPKGQMNEMFFLSKEEQENLERKKDGKNCKGMKVPLIEPNLNESSISLKGWKIGQTTSSVLCNTWNKVAKSNELKHRDTIQVWSFRVQDGRVGLALVKLQN